MMRIITLTLLALASCCCSPRVQQVAAQSVEAAVVTNNALVSALTAAQESAKLRRKAAMIQAVQQAGSYAAGQEALDAIDRRYRAVAEAFEAAERIQGELAVALELAQLAVRTGNRPDLARVIELYAQLQRSYSAVLTALGRAHG